MLMKWLSRWFLVLTLIPGIMPVLAQTGTSATRNPAEFRYAVTLISSFEPIPDSMLPRDIPDNVYRTQVSVFGRNIYFVRMGFYATAGEADLAKQRMQARYPAALVTEITSDEYIKTTGGKPKALPEATNPKTSPALPPPAAPPVMAAPTPPLPKTTPPTPAVPATTDTLLPPAEPAAAPITPPAPAITSTIAPAVDDATRLMEKARDALSRNDNATAISLLGNLLRLPPNAHSQDAQELIGLAHERLNETATARQEYNLYLRLYPEGPGADRVRQRLAALEPPAPPPVALKKPALRDAGPASMRGSFSQFYYYGQSQIDSNTTILGPTTNTSLTSTDQSALYNHLDVRARATSGNWDNRFVFQDSYVASFLDNVDSYNRLYSAYYELTNRVDEYSGRFGRQPGASGGVLGRFDGVQLGYNVLPKWRLNVTAGVPVDFYPTNYSKQFWGVSLDYGLFANHWNGSLYYLQQTVDGIADRQAVGTEVRFFDPKGSALLYLDYDTLFGMLNIASFQSTWFSSTTTTWNLLLDHRLAPTLMTSNALFSAPSGSTISSLLATLTETQLRQQASDNSPTFDTYMLGVAHNLNNTWQIGGDLRHFNLSSPVTSPTITTVLGTGGTTMYTLQTIANGLFRQRDLSVLSISFMSGASYTGESIAFTHRMLFQDRWSVDLALSYYLQQNEPVQSVDTVSGDTLSTQSDDNRIAPRMRVSYRWGRNATFETELGMEIGTSHSQVTNLTTPGTPTTTTSDTSRHYLMLGYRWNF